MTRGFVERAARLLAARTDRRGFLVRTALAGSALAVDPITFVLRPTSAYAATCRCGNPGCRCSSLCCDGYTEFCCTITGSNTCPPGTFAGGWWKADGSQFCGGPRYYIDCHTQCSCGSGCQPGGDSFCTQECDPATCGCHGGDCGNRVSGCVTFRYGQCHTEIACSGRILCRVVSCVPAYVLEPTCSTVAMQDDNTANHNSPCLEDPAAGLGSYSFAGLREGAWLAGRDGGVFSFGSAAFHGSMGAVSLRSPIVGISATPSGNGYWLVGADGGVFAFGDAGFFGSTGSLRLARPIVALTPTAGGKGYWLVASDGGVFAFGDASFLGSTGAMTLDEPIVALTATPSRKGYWLVARDGGVFAFGDAAFHGSTGGRVLRAPIAGLTATPSGRGYLLWARDGEVYPFGDAPDFGSYPRMMAGRPDVPGGGLDTFVGLSPTLVTHGAVTAIAGYTLWSTSQVSPPPSAHAFHFAITS